MTEVDRMKLIDHIESEVEDAMPAHEEREDRMDVWQKAYDGEPEVERKSFPWPGAANIEIPLIAIAVDSIVARMMNTIYGVDPFWTVQPLRKEVELVAKPVERYLDWSRKNEFSFYDQTRRFMLENVKFGWSWLKFGWEAFVKKEIMIGRDGSPLEQSYVVRRPVIYHVLNRDVIVQGGMEDEEEAEWIAHRFRISDNSLRRRAAGDVYDREMVDKVMKQKEDINRTHEALKSSRNEPMPVQEKLNQFYEFNIDYAMIGDDDYPMPLLITYHRPTKTILRAIYNPYGACTFKKAKFIEREGRLEGYGIARRLYQMQKEISTIHNQEVDNATIANTMCFLGKRGEVKTNTQFWPGRVFPVSDVEKSFKPFSMGTPGGLGAMRALELAVMAYSERASGISDYQLGRESPSVGSRATATGTLALIQEGNRRFDLNIRDIRVCFSEAGRRLLELNQRFRPQGAAYFVQGAEGRWTEEVLNLPPEFSASKLAVELTASTASINRSTAKQELIALMGICKQYYDSMTQAAMVLANPQIPGEVKEVVAKELIGGRHLMKKIVQEFDMKDIDTIVPGIIPDQEDQANAAANGAGGPAGGPQGGQGDPRMEQILRARGGFGGGGEGGDAGGGDVGGYSS